ncbi:MAG: lipopolysaccharide biosynthesis protein [Cyanobacteria bacterium J06560_2]
MSTKPTKNSTNLKQEAVKGALWTAIQNWVSQAGSLVVFFVLARLLQPESFGLVALANGCLAFMQIFLEQGFAQALIQRKTLEPEHLDTSFWTNVAIGVTGASLSFLVADWVAVGFDQPQLAPVLRWFSVIFLVISLRGTQQALLERQFNFKAIAARTIVGTLVGGIVGISMALTGWGVWSLVGQQLTSRILGTLVLWVASDWRPRLRFSLSHFKQLFSFGSSLLAVNFIGFFNTRINDFLIGYFLGPVALGYYAIAYRVLQVSTQLLVRTTSSVALPAFSRLSHDLPRFRSAFCSVTRLTSAIAFPIFTGMAVLAPQLVLLLFGQTWQPAVPIIRLLAISGMVRSISFFKSSVLIAIGQPIWTVRLKLLSVAINLIGFAITYRWGLQAVTAAIVIGGLVVFPVGQWAVSRLIALPLKQYLQQFAMPLLSAIAMIPVMILAQRAVISPVEILLLNRQWLSESGLFDLLSLGVLSSFGAGSYLILIRLLSPQIFCDFLEIGRLLLSKKSRKKTV